MDCIGISFFRINYATTLAVTHCVCMCECATAKFPIQYIFPIYSRFSSCLNAVFLFLSAIVIVTNLSIAGGHEKKNVAQANLF